MLLDAERQVEIFGRAAVPAADAPQEVAAEDAERAGDVVYETEGIEARATQVYRERVLEGLEARHEAAAGVAGAQVSRHRDDVLIGEVPYGVPHHVVVEGGVAVEGHDDLAGSQREPLVHARATPAALQLGADLEAPELPPFYVRRKRPQGRQGRA